MGGIGKLGVSPGKEGGDNKEVALCLARSIMRASGDSHKGPRKDLGTRGSPYLISVTYSSLRTSAAPKRSRSSSFLKADHDHNLRRLF